MLSKVAQHSRHLVIPWPLTINWFARVAQEGGRSGVPRSCPPSSLVSPKRVVGCRGGSRYAEGCWGVPRRPYVLYWHSRGSLCALLSISKSHLSFLRFCKFQTSQFSNFQSFKISQFSKFIISNSFAHIVSNTFKHSDHMIYTNNIFEKVSMIFLYCLK